MISVSYTHLDVYKRQGVPQAQVAGITLASPYQYYLLAMPLAALALVLLINLQRSNVGRKLTAVRIDPIAAQSMGIYPDRVKALAFTVSGAIAALALSLIHISATPNIEPTIIPFAKPFICVLLSTDRRPGALSARSAHPAPRRRLSAAQAQIRRR